MTARLIPTTVELACGHWTSWTYDRSAPPAEPLTELPCGPCGATQRIRVMHG